MTVLRGVCVLVMLVGCGPTSTGGDDGGGSGSGGGSCTADHANASSTVGCNGAPIGSSVSANEFGGICQADPNQPDALVRGSCRAASDVCAHASGDTVGMCIRPCDAASTYVSDGGCPTGSRCFTIDAAFGNVYCYPDCRSGDDCASGMCDGDGACVTP